MKALARALSGWLLLVGVSALTGAPVAASPPDFSALVEENSPAVVNISSEQDASTTQASRPKLPFELPEGMELPDGVPLEEFLRRFLGELGESPELPSESLGSGFIISADGYVLTNHHVVKDADQIIVRLSDRSELPAKLVGSDERSDIALLKVEPKNGPLPTVKIGDPARLKAGQWVLAIGSPFGFDHSVTAGIVSAKGRALPQETYVPFIQTDVAINPGNSGGPLFNLDGEVVGINSQIYSRTGGFMGLSFAVPIDVAMDVVDQLKKSGKVTRGWLGVMIQDVTRELAESFGMAQPRGALVARVMPDGPAAKAGIEPGDIILRFDGEDVVYSSDLPPRVGRTAIGRKVAVDILHAGKPRTLQLVVEALPAEAAPVAGKSASAKVSVDRLGLAVADLTPAQRERLGIDRGGVRVRRVEAGAARDAGVQTGDVILSVNSDAVDDAAEYRRLVERLPAGKVARLLVQRGDDSLWLALRVPK
ncbi:DegQ family serine endoprotease [Immundisolibacter sp.]|uniref:DegQ family serine endoprotease n=1 Tax=Immundisolibacter sp. TaxID=1934948 RepID=UPI0026272D68|nr:DegQ family serine endoprotease [Immundisolibacter sp.]MDD3650655.1 DegQ family serine endoprotease [Immundisolibacter sp.]